MRGRVVANHKALPSRSSNNHRSNDINGSRTTNTSTNVSPSLNDNNSRTALLGSDDMRSPAHHISSHNKRKQRSRHVHTDSTAEYDDVASRSTVDDTTPQTSSENASMSELPFDARFKTFVKQKKNKTQATSNGGVLITNSTPIATIDRYDKQLPPVPVDSEDTENEATTDLLSQYRNEEDTPRIAVVTSTDESTQNGANSNKRVSGTSNASHHHNGASHDERSNEMTQEEDGAYDICEQNNNTNKNDSRASPTLKQNHRKKQSNGNNNNNNNDNEDESEDSADEDEEDVEEGVYDLGTSNLILD